MAVVARILLLVAAAQAGHFNGGSIRWTPLNSSAMASPIQIMISQTYSYTLANVVCSIGSLVGTTGVEAHYNLSCSLNCGTTSAGYTPPPVVGYCLGFNSGLGIAFSQRSDVVNLAAGDYFSVTFGILNTLTTGYYRPLTVVGSNTTISAHWNITSAIDVRVRADNGRINTPPVANMISPRGIPLNIPTTIVIPTLDIDNDNVRCRWGNGSLECGGACYPSTVPLSTTLSSNCILNITGTSLSTWYAGSIQVEDFSTSSSTTPLSSIPVQFLMYVYAPKNCSIPTLTGPSSCIDVQVGVSSTVTLTATNNCGSTSNISDVLVQSLTGIVQGSLTPVNAPLVYKRDITYTPLATQLGPQIMCAIALDDTNVPSDQYCITFIVGTTTAGSVCSSLLSTTNSPSVSTTEHTSNGSSINWALIGSIVGLLILCSLVVCLWCCYYFFWAGKIRLRRRQRQRLMRSPTDATINNRSECSTTTSSFPLKSSNIFNVDLTTQDTAKNDSWTPPVTDGMSNKVSLLSQQSPDAIEIEHGTKSATNDSGTRPVTDVMSNKVSLLSQQSSDAIQIEHDKKSAKNTINIDVRQTESMSPRQLFSSNEHCPTALVKDTMHVASAGQLYPASESGDSVNDEDGKQAKSKSKTKKSRKVRKIKSITVRPMTKAEQDRITNDNQLRKPMGQSTIHVTRVLR